MARMSGMDLAISAGHDPEVANYERFLADFRLLAEGCNPGAVEAACEIISEHLQRYSQKYMYRIT